MAASAACIVHFIVWTIDTHFDANTSFEIPRSHHRTQESAPHALFIVRSLRRFISIKLTNREMPTMAFECALFPICAAIYERIMEWLRILTAGAHNWLQHFYGICLWNSICPCNRGTISNGTGATTIAVGMRALRHETCTVRNSVIQRNRTAAIQNGWNMDVYIYSNDPQRYSFGLFRRVLFNCNSFCSHFFRNRLLSGLKIKWKKKKPQPLIDGPICLWAQTHTLAAVCTLA